MGIERRFTPIEPAEATPSPVDLAERREGRPPAPLGTREPGTDAQEGSPDG